jgi:hypothetical protein
VQEILVDGRQLVFELGLQVSDDLGVALHGDFLLLTCEHGWMGLGSGADLAIVLRGPALPQGKTPGARCGCG